MIPKKIHYCWFGRGEMPELAKECIASWHKYMPDYEYKLWNEDNFDVNAVPYTKEAYEVRKFAFVSDYVRLWALEREGGIYMDVDFEVNRATVNDVKKALQDFQNQIDKVGKNYTISDELKKASSSAKELVNILNQS